MEATSGNYEYVVEIDKVNGEADARKYNNRLKKRLRLIPDENFTAGVAGDRDICQNSNAVVEVPLQGPGSVRWYDQPEGGNLLAEGRSALIPVGEQNTVVYAEVSPGEKIGRLDNSVNSFEYSNQEYGLVFDAFTPFTIKTVKVYTEEAGSRLLRLTLPDGSALTKVVAMDVGEQRVTLDWEISEPGEDYRLELRAGKPMGFNTGGSTYPYEINNVVAIRRSTQGLPFYHYFYDWEIEYPYYCGRVALEVEVSEDSGPQVGFSPAETTV